MRKHALLLTASIVMACASPAAAGEARLYVAPYFQASQLTADGRVEGSAGGTDFNLEDTLGVDPDQSLAGVDFFVKFLGMRFQASYNKDESSGSETLSDDFAFEDTLFGAGDEVETELKLERYEGLLGFDFSAIVVNAGILAGVQVINLDSSIASDAGELEEKDLHLPIPVIGASLGIHPGDKLAIHAKLTGMAATVSDIDAKLLDGFVGLDYYFIPKFGLTIGYKVFILDAEDKDEGNEVDMNQTGPYAGLSFHL